MNDINAALTALDKAVPGLGAIAKAAYVEDDEEPTGDHGPDCVDVVNHEGCDNGYACRDSSPMGEEPPDIYHECASTDHYTLPSPEDT